MMNRNIESEIPFFRPSIGEREEEAVLRVLRSGWLTTGREAAAFESEFCIKTGTKHALAVNSATAGLHLALEAAGVGKGGRVLTTPFTFTASAEVIIYRGAQPVFVDIEPETMNIAPDRFEEAAQVAEQAPIQAGIPVHLSGHPCRCEALSSTAQRYGFPLIDDAAHVQPGVLNFPGSLAAVYSFYATKPLATGEGGMVTTASEELSKRIALMRLHGIDRTVWDRYTAVKQKGWEYDVTAPGYKYNLPDTAAAIGRVQLERGDEFLTRRRRLARIYRRALRDEDYLRLPPDHADHSWHLFILRLRPEKMTVSRDQFLDDLNRMGIGTSVHFKPLHLMSYYRKRFGFRPEDFPVSLETYRNCLSLPLYPDLTEEQMDRIIKAVKQTGARYYRRDVLVT